MHPVNDNGKDKWFITLCCFFMLFIFSNTKAAVNAFDKAIDHPEIPLLDEQGVHVLESTNPYSPKKSCEGSGCHDYEAITSAYHFQMGRDEASDDYGAKRGLPHLVSPGYYGGYTCMGGDNPQILAKKNNPGGINNFADFGSAGYVKTCMSCHAGGGWAEKDREGIRYDKKNSADIKFGDGDYYERGVMDGKKQLVLHDWKKSGVGEADCLFCHIDFSTLKLPADSGLEEHKGVRSARQAFSNKGMFRQAATGLMELVVNKDGTNLVTVKREPKGDSVKLVKDNNDNPIFNWNKAAFDENGRVIISMLRFPKNENCMECHRTSNGRRGFYGFGEDAAATLEGEDADNLLQDDYKDDIHKGKIYVENNGQSRVIDNCNACHSKQYYKSNLASIDLDANHDFPKGNSDMDVRSDLDYAPNVKSCEECHIRSNKPIIPSGHDTLLAAHRELWKGNGDMAGYHKESLTKITKTHFDVVACQSCHITDKKDKGGESINMLYRYRAAEDGKLKIIPYQPSHRALWRDKVSGHVLSKVEKRIANSDPQTYDEFLQVKTAYDGMLQEKGFANPNTALYISEANEYIISHNTRPSPDSVPCGDCHERKQNGAFSSLVSPNGIFGAKEIEVKGRFTIPDPRLVKEGHIILDMKYTKMKENGELIQTVDDILYETKIDPFMSLLRNSSASEILGEFRKVSRDNILASVEPALASRMAPDLPSNDGYFFSVNKGDFSLRNMAALIDGNTINNILFPTYRGVLGLLKDAIPAANGILKTRGYGHLRSDVFYFEVRDSAGKHVEFFNGASMFVLATYKGTKTNINDINVVVANWALTSIEAVPMSELVAIQSAIDGNDGYVIFKMNKPGYFIVADKLFIVADQ